MPPVMFGCARDEVDDRAHFRLGRRDTDRRRAARTPAATTREIAIEVESLHGLLDAQREAVVVLDRAFGHDAVVRAARLRRLAPDHEARLVRDAPSTRRSASAMRICRMRPSPSMSSTVSPSRSSSPCGYGRVLERIHLRLVGERPFRAVGIDARADVERARVERARDVGVAAVLRHQRVQEIEVRGRRRDFGGVDVAVDPERGLVRGGAGRGVGDGHHPDVAALVALADRLDRRRVRGCSRANACRSSVSSA